MTPRQNPFRAEKLDSVPFIFHDTSAAELLSRLEKFHCRAAVIGAHGRGKSTLLDALAPFLQARGWQVHRLHLNSSQRNFPREDWREFRLLNTQDFILLDGAEQLSLWQRKRFLYATRRAAGVLLTAHRAGILPTLYECRSSSQLLQTLISQIAPQPQHSEKFSEGFTKELFARHHGNLRDALREMYDVCAQESQR